MLMSNKILSSTKNYLQFIDLWTENSVSVFWWLAKRGHKDFAWKGEKFS